MAPPTGTITVTLTTWSDGTTHYACDSGNQFIAHSVSAATRGLAILKAQSAVKAAMRRQAEIWEPYYVDELMSQPIFWSY